MIKQTNKMRYKPTGIQQVGIMGKKKKKKESQLVTEPNDLVVICF